MSSWRVFALNLYENIIKLSECDEQKDRKKRTNKL